VAIRNFIIQFLGVTALAVAMVFGFMQVFVGWKTHQDFALVMLGAFAGISTFLFTLGNITAKSPDKYLFHGVIMGSVLIKLVVALGALFVYDRNYSPLNNQFIWIFLLIYVIYTAWEVRFMTELAKMK
jgi:hypothetical protein